MNPLPPDDDYRPTPISPGYLVSRDGRVFTCRHTGGVWRELKQYHPKRSRGTRFDRGPKVTLFVGPRGKVRREVWPVAKLVALTFLGPKPPGMFLVVRPVGSLRADDMKYMTAEERRAARPKQCGEQGANCKLTAVRVVAIRRAVAAAVADGQTPDWAALSAEHRVCADNIKAVATGRSWRHIDAGVPLWVPPKRRLIAPGERWSAKLTEEQVRDIRRRKANRESHKSAQDSYVARGFSRYSFDGAWYGHTWKWLKL